jgi:hypothetical protein
MSYSEQAGQDSKESAKNSFNFFSDSSFEAFLDDDGEFFIINNCRMTLTTDANKKALQKLTSEDNDPENDIDAENDIVIALYLKGEVFRVEDSGSNKSYLTASGQCVYFKLKKSDSGDIKYQTQLRIRKTAPFYFKDEDSMNFHKSTFQKIVNVGSTIIAANSSSPTSGHTRQLIGLFPDKK